jgi:transposase
MRQRFDLSDEQWAKIEPFLPPQRPRTGRPSVDHRRILNGILWILRTGAPWQDLPERYGPVGTVSSRFYRWRKAGIWDRILAQVQQQADQEGRIDWAVHYVDGTSVRAHPHAAGAKGGTQKRRRWATAEEASRPKSTSVPKERANP